MYVHCKYIGRKYYDILSCLIYHRNFVVFITVDGGVQPMVAADFDYRDTQQVALCINWASAFFENVILTMYFIAFSWIYDSKSYDQQKAQNRIPKIVQIAV